MNRSESECIFSRAETNSCEASSILSNAALFECAQNKRLASAGKAQPSEPVRKHNGQESKNTGWTLAVDLTANLKLRDGSYAGAIHQWERIRSLAESTRGKPVSLLVQVSEPADRAQNDPFANPYNKHEIGTYLIKDGQVKLLAKKESRGAEADLSELLEQAASRPGKLGLVIQSHGGAVNGLGADNGSISLQSLTNSIEKSLTGTGRNSLDLLDFDSCEMGHMEVLDRIAPSVKHVLASSDVECARPGITDGQNLKAALSDLISNPTMTAGELADDFVRRAHAGANGFPEARLYLRSKGGTDTLAHYDMDNFQQMERAIDQLGLALSECASNPGDKKTIEEVFSKTRPIPEEHPYVWPHKIEQKDLLLLTDALMGAVRSGSIHDESGRLAAALDAVSEAQNKLIKSHYGDQLSGLVYSGGLGIFAPDSDLTGLPEVTRENLKLTQLSHSCTNIRDKDLGTAVMEFIKPALRDKIEDCKIDLLKINTQEALALMESLDKQAAALVGAASASDQRAALDGLKKVLDEQVSPQLVDDLVKLQKERMKEAVNQEILKHSLKGAPHWIQFIQSL